MNEIDLHGVIDLHVHAAPDVEPRRANDIEIAAAAADAGMRALLFKSHVTHTADRATITEKVVQGIRLFGGLTLNYPMGGFNPAAVQVAIQFGAREIWMPSKDSAHERDYRGQSGGLSIFDRDGHIRPEVHEIVELIRQANIILGTGHLSIDETIALVRLAHEHGVRKIVVTHPEAYFIKMPVAVQKDLAALGAYLERCYVFATKLAGATISVGEIAMQIREVGAESTVLSTDLGQPANPMPVDGMRAYLGGLAAAGLELDTIRLMVSENPASLLDLS